MPGTNIHSSWHATAAACIRMTQCLRRCAWKALSLVSGSLNGIQNVSSPQAHKITDLGHSTFELLVVHGFSGVFISCCLDLKVGLLKFFHNPTLDFPGGLLQRIQIGVLELAVR